MLQLLQCDQRIHPAEIMIKNEKRKKKCLVIINNQYEDFHVKLSNSLRKGGKKKGKKGKKNKKAYFV